MGSSHSNTMMIETFNRHHAKIPNKIKQYESIVFKYLFSNYRMFPQWKQYDFYLPDFNIFIEIDEEHHFNSGNSQKRIKNAKQDNYKILKCLLQSATLIRLSWFSVANKTYKKIIKYCIEKKLVGKVLLSSKEIYENLDMLNNINKENIIYYS